MYNKSSPLFKASLFVWFVALVFYGTGVLSLGISYLRFPAFGYIALPADVIAALLLQLTQLPVPLLFIFRNATVYASFGLTYTDNNYPYQVAPGKFSLGDGTWTGGYVLFLIGLVGVILCALALKNASKQRKWAWVFIGLALSALLLSIIDAITGVCHSVAWEFGGGTYAFCQFGFSSALPNFFSSTILFIASIVVYRATHKKKPLLSDTSVA